jgi:hypothetical protein
VLPGDGVTAAEAAFGPLLDLASAPRGVAVHDIAQRAVVAIDGLAESDRGEFAGLLEAWAASVPRLRQAAPVMREMGFDCQWRKA